MRTFLYIFNQEKLHKKWRFFETNSKNQVEPVEIYHIKPNSGKGAKEMPKGNVILAKNAILTKGKKVTDDCPQRYKFFRASCLSGCYNQDFSHIFIAACRVLFEIDFFRHSGSGRPGGKLKKDTSRSQLLGLLLR